MTHLPPPLPHLPPTHSDATGQVAGRLVPGLAPAWSRRAWLTQAAVLGVAARVRPGGPRLGSTGTARCVPRGADDVAARLAAQATLADPAALEALAQRAVDAARAAGASYAEARLTRTVQHSYGLVDKPNVLRSSGEALGLGVRALAHGAWGFSASPFWTPDEASRLAQDAVAQAKINAQGREHPVELSPAPAVQGRWATPIRLDPFKIMLEEKSDTFAYWDACAKPYGLSIDPMRSYINIARQEQTVATSEGTLISQTLYESGGLLVVGSGFAVHDVDMAGKGWELFLDADIPGQFPKLRDEILAAQAVPTKPATVGKYTLVCDGVTMGRLVEHTFGIATQLDRALGYEANAGGTSFLDDPLAMLGTLQVAAPMVTITANRSAPAQLATVQWDAEGVVPQETTLVKDGILVDYQTTREQAPWLAPYYQRVGKPVTSHGYAVAEDGLAITLQQMPNLALEPGHSSVGLMDLVSDVQDGILVTELKALEGIHTDHQARNGVFGGVMRQIKNGRLGPWLVNGAVLFNTQAFWKHLKAVGGPATAGVYSMSVRDDLTQLILKAGGLGKGQPPQVTGHSVRGAAALIPDQSVIDIARKA